ncbi:MAG: DUF4153 domain-containing protein [Desulfuromonadales bacterium]|nr:DUF4153 domain-containing protein [Desulfuromonadales bacterium]
MKVTWKNIWPVAIDTLRRFPFAATCAVGAAISAIATNHYRDALEEEMIRLLLTSMVGFLLFLVLQLFVERIKISPGRALLVKLAGSLILANYYLFFTEIDGGVPMTLRCTQIAFALALFIPLTPFPMRNKLLQFWQFGLSLLLRAGYSVAIALFLQLALSAALLSVEYLFGIDVSHRLYTDLWFLLTLMLVPITFLAGIPDKEDTLSKVDSGPRWLDVTLRNAIIPTVLLYLIILYVYIGKIILMASWPKGGVAGYVIGFCALGVASYVLIAPDSVDTEAPFLKRRFHRFFWPLLIPLSAMLFMSVWRRIDEYGVTESRYAGVVLAIWLATMAICFLSPLKRNLQILFVSLALTSLVCAFGPWSATNMSIQSQLGRLEKLLTEKGLLVEGKVATASGVSHADEVEISQLFRYLDQRKTLSLVENWFEQPVEKETAESLVEAIGLQYSLNEYSSRWLNFYAKKDDTAHDISGYDYMAKFSQRNCNNGTASKKTYDNTMTILLDYDAKELSVERQGEIITKINFAPQLEQLIKNHPNSSTRKDIPQEELFFEYQEQGARLLLEIQRVGFKKQASENLMKSIEARVFVDLH